MNRFIDKLREELEQENKSLIDFDRCFNLLDDIQDDMDMLESESQDFEDMNYDLERKVDDLEEELEEYKQSEKRKSQTLDDVYKEELFEELSKKYTYWNLEELLKNKSIM